MSPLQCGGSQTDLVCEEKHDITRESSDGGGCGAGTLSSLDLH